MYHSRGHATAEEAARAHDRLMLKIRGEDVSGRREGGREGGRESGTEMLRGRR